MNEIDSPTESKQEQSETQWKPKQGHSSYKAMPCKERLKIQERPSACPTLTQEQHINNTRFWWSNLGV
jgi:hypothetical protein